MKQFLLFAFAIILFSLSAESQTNVSGNITQNTTWTKAGSPYTLVGNVGIPSAYTLTIEPGVVVQRDANYQILANGALQIAGTQTDSIVFRSSFQRLPNTPHFIEFQKSTLGNSHISFISFDAPNGISNNIRLGNESSSIQTNPKNSGTLFITHSNLGNGYTTTKGYNTTAELRIDSCVMPSGYMLGDEVFSEPIYISHTQITSSIIETNVYNRGISFDNCEMDMVKLRCASRLSITGSRVVNSGLANLLYTSVITITGCEFITTSIYTPPSRCLVTNSTFTVTGQLYRADDFLTDVMLSAGSVVITSSSLLNQTATDYTGIYVSESNVSDSIGNIVTINKNRFDGFYDAIVLKDFFNIHLDSNDFYNSGRYSIVNNNLKDFSALHNYFQLKQGQTIDDLIFDQNDDLNYGLVTYTPYAQSPNTGVLPVALAGFTGNAYGNSIVLHWQTGSEVNVSRFTVQKKTGSGYIDIGTVLSSNTGGGTRYSFTDNSPAAGTGYYRLQIIDRDGNYAYSAAIPVAYNNTVKTWRIYPNPASAYIVVEHGAATIHTQLQLMNAGGVVIKTIAVAEGSIQSRMNISGVAKGVYKMIMKDNATIESQAVLIQ